MAVGNVQITGTSVARRATLLTVHAAAKDRAGAGAAGFGHRPASALAEQLLILSVPCIS